MFPRLVEQELKEYLANVCVNLVLEYADDTMQEMLIKLHNLKNRGIYISDHHDLHTDPRALKYELAVIAAKENERKRKQLMLWSNTREGWRLRQELRFKNY